MRVGRELVRRKDSNVEEKKNVRRRERVGTEGDRRCSAPAGEASDDQGEKRRRHGAGDQRRPEGGGAGAAVDQLAGAQEFRPQIRSVMALISCNESTSSRLTSASVDRRYLIHSHRISGLALVLRHHFLYSMLDVSLEHLKQKNRPQNEPTRNNQVKLGQIYQRSEDGCYIKAKIDFSLRQISPHDSW